jgi:sporulation protein YlmC with PRC-barrel domain
MVRILRYPVEVSAGAISNPVRTHQEKLMKTNLVKMIGCLVVTGSTAMTVVPYVSAESAQATQPSRDRVLASMDVDKIEGKDVLDSSGKQLGDVDEVVVNKSNQTMAVIGLEDSDKEVAVPLSRLTLAADGKNLITQLSRAELLAMPDYDPMDMESVDD